MRDRSLVYLSVYGPRMLADPKTIDILAMLSVLPDGFPDNETVMEELESHLPEGYDHWKALLTMWRVLLVQVEEAGATHRLQLLSPVCAFCEQRLEASEELKNSITSFYVEKMDCFMDIRDSDGHTIILGELDNVYAVLVQAWKQGRGSSMIANASIQFTDWSRYVGNPVEKVIGLAIQGVVGLPGLHGRCHLAIGEVYLQQNKLDKAEASFKCAVELHQQAHDVFGEANDVGTLGVVYLQQNRLDEAKASFKCAAELCQQVHSVFGEANNARTLGEVYLRQDKLDKAETSFKHATKLYWQVHDILGEANNLGNLGAVYLQQDKLDEAEALFKYAAKLHRQIHFFFGVATDVGILEVVYLWQNKLDEPEALSEQAAKLYQQIHFVFGEVNNVGNLGEVYLQQDKLDKAEASFEYAAELHQQAHDVLGEANDILKLGEVYL